LNRQLNEDLREGDLRGLVHHIFEIDSYSSKMGEDADVVVISFTVESKDPAEDLVNFVERGYDFVLDADVTPGELNDGKYKVFVEIERNRKISDQIAEMIDGVKKLTGLDKFKFRYYKSFKSLPADESNLTEVVPTSKDDYEVKIQENNLNNFSNFFNQSYIESISVDDEDIVFQKKYADPLRLKIKNFGLKKDVYNSISGPMMIESKDIAEVLYITKYVGNFNINKIGNCFIFENKNYALALEMT
jgi:hypothetical protein